MCMGPSTEVRQGRAGADRRVGKGTAVHDRILPWGMQVLAVHKPVEELFDCSVQQAAEGA